MIFKRNLHNTALASAIILAFGGGFAPVVMAQTTTGDQAQSASGEAVTKQAKEQKETTAKRPVVQKMQTVEVVGFVSSVVNSTAIKRNSNSIVEVVSSEQVGKLPGVSIADALGRLPGLAVQRVSGRPQVLSIHGLGPDFSTALVNGGQQVSTSNNRDVQFDQYPSSWFDAVVVHLTPSADLLGQGLTGTVDMHTIRPLQKHKPMAAINAHYIWNGMSQLAHGPGVSNQGHNVNGVWVHQFANHTIGVTLGASTEDNPTQIEHQGSWGYASDANGDLVTGGSKNYGITDSMKRNGLLATVQWQPNQHYLGTIDMTYDHFSEAQQAKGNELPLFYGSAGVPPVPTLTPGNVANGFVESGTYTNINPVVRNDYNKTTARVYNFNWDNQIRFNADWKADIDANYSRATRRDLLLESYSGSGYYLGPDAQLVGGAITGTGPHGPGYTFGFAEAPSGMLAITNPPDLTTGQVLTDPQGWGAGSGVVQSGFINAPRTVDYLANLKMSVTRSFVSGPISSVELGVDRGTRNKTYNINQSFLTFAPGVHSMPMPTTTQGSPLAWMGMGPQLIYDPISLIQDGTYTVFPTELSSIAVPPNWQVRERDFASYLQANLDTYLGDITLRGNFGVQVAHTSQSSAGQRVAASLGGTHGVDVELLPVSGGTHYTRYLPSFNLVFGFTPSDLLRVSAARTIARPRMDQMSASLGVSGNITELPETDPNKSFFSASGGNAKLLPTKADNYNVSFEHYFTGGNSFACNSADAKTSALCTGGGGYFALSGYYLKLSDYINPNAAYLFDFKNFVDAYLTAAQQQQLGTTMGIVSGPVNDGHGYVEGAQATLNLPLNLLTPVLNGFGVIFTGNRTKSSVKYPGNPDAITVPGLSKWVADATVYYQHGGFQARVSDSYRSTFLGRVSGISATRVEQDIQGGSWYAAQVSYTWHTGALSGLTLVAQGSNLSNQTAVTFQNGDPRQVLNWERYGRRFDVGISYKFQ